MDRIAKGFYQSLWQASARGAFETSSLDDHLEVETVIIGGGFTGLSSALHLARMGRSVALLEAQEIAWGGSGRNGAQVNPGWYILPSRIRELYGPQRGERVLQFINGACDLVFSLIDEFNIDCAVRRAPSTRAAYGHNGIRQVEQWVREWSAVGAPVELRSLHETRDILGTGYFHGCFEDHRGGSLQPLSYAHGLARAAHSLGAGIFRRTPVVSLRRVGSDWLAFTARGHKVKARYVIIATNGYTDQLWPGLKRQVIPLVTRQTASEPLPQSLREEILPRGHHVSDTRNNMTYFRIDEQGRFQIGGRGNPFSTRSQYGSTRHLRAAALRIYPQLRGIKWEYDWGGLVALTRNHAPQLLQLGPNAYAGLGYNGRGVAMGTLMGQQLADRIAGEDVPMPCESLAPIRFHQFRNIGTAWHLFSGAVRDYLEGRKYQHGQGA